MLGKERDTDAGRDDRRVAASQKRMRPDCVQELSSQGLCLSAPRVRQEDGKLVAAQPRDEVAVSLSAAKQRRQPEEHCIPRAVAQAVIDPFEVIKIQK